MALPYLKFDFNLLVRLDEISFMLITSIGTADSVTVLGALRESTTTS
jgi:hypothetical protein